MWPVVGLWWLWAALALAAASITDLRSWWQASRSLGEAEDGLKLLAQQGYMPSESDLLTTIKCLQDSREGLALTALAIQLWPGSITGPIFQVVMQAGCSLTSRVLLRHCRAACSLSLTARFAVAKAFLKGIAELQGMCDGDPEYFKDCMDIIDPAYTLTGDILSDAIWAHHKWNCARMATDCLWSPSAEMRECGIKARLEANVSFDPVFLKALGDNNCELAQRLVELVDPFGCDPFMNISLFKWSTGHPSNVSLRLAQRQIAVLWDRVRDIYLAIIFEGSQVLCTTEWKDVLVVVSEKLLCLEYSERRNRVPPFLFDVCKL